MKPPPEVSPEVIQKENRMLLERLMIISKRKRERTGLKAGRIDYKAVHKSLRIKS